MGELVAIETIKEPTTDQLGGSLCSRELPVANLAQRPKRRPQKPLKNEIALLNSAKKGLGNDLIERLPIGAGFDELLPASHCECPNDAATRDCGQNVHFRQPSQFCKSSQDSQVKDGGAKSSTRQGQRDSRNDCLDFLRQNVHGWPAIW